MANSDFLATIKTREDVDLLLSEIAALKEGIYKTDGGLDAVLTTAVRKSTAGLISQAFGRGVDKEEFLSGLENQLSNLKEVKLTLAFEPTQEAIDNIHAWLQKNLGPGILMEVSFDKSVLGGAVIEYGGKYLDLSLNKKLEGYLG